VQQRRRAHLPSFLAGFASALFLFLLLFGGVVLLLTYHGVTVTLNSGEIARMVRERVVIQAREDLPRLIDTAKTKIPSIVEAQMREQLISDRMEIAGFVFRVPEELLGQLRQSIRESAEQAATKILEGVDTSALAENMGDNVYLTVQETLSQELHGKIFEVLAYGRLPLRVRLQISN